MDKLTQTIVEAIDDKKGKDIVVIDMTGVDSSICDAFVITSGDSTTQVSAIAEGVEEKVLKDLNEKVWRVEGKDNSIWIVMDYGNVMVHIFQNESRDFYALEELWSDQPQDRISFE